MSRRDVRLERAEYPAAPMPPPSKCAKVLYYTWRLCSVVFSHFVMISLVVAYCILGAVTFERLEAQHEREVKMNISRIRDNTTQSMWLMTTKAPLLNQSNWTSDAVNMLKDFENAILLEMKVRGWDGNESTEHIQWTFTGALFYSIIVITTIGYGHIAPKTQTGKVVTIFYAILGIPLMLLCLSNIGDVMASSFRFLYWRVCCYVCTRPPKRRHRHHPYSYSVRRSARAGTVRGSTRKRRPIERAHSDTDCRYRDSGYSSGRPKKARAPAAAARTRSQPPATLPRVYPSQGVINSDREDKSPMHYQRCARGDDDDEQIEFPKICLPLQDLEAALKELDSHQKRLSTKSELRSKSLPRPAKAKSDLGPRTDFDDYRHYDDEDQGNTFEMHDLHDVDYENYKEKLALEERNRRGREMNEVHKRGNSYDPEDDDFEFDSPRRRPRYDWRNERGRSEYYERDPDDWERPARRGRRARSAMYEHERWDDELPDGRAGNGWNDRWRRDRYEDWRRDPEAGRSRPQDKARRLRRLHTVDNTRLGRHTPRPNRHYSPSPDRDEWSDEIVPVPKRYRPPAWESRPSDLNAIEAAKEEIKPVPIWLCVFLVASYIVAGTFLFKRWEGWAYLDAAYFCFITLTTIGFGDFVPAQGQSTDEPAAAVHSIALCSLYLLFGIALLAMSFNLVQEEVRANVAAVATRLGIIKPRARDDDADY